MRFYQLITLAFLTILPSFPLQGDIKVIYGVILLALLLLPVFVKNVRIDIKKRKVTTIFFLLFLLSGAISTIFSIDQKQSFLQLLLYISYFVIFTSVRTIFPNLKSKELLVTCYLLLVTVLSLISLYNTLVLHYVNRAPEGVSFMWIYYGHNHLSALLIFAIPISLYFLLRFLHRPRSPSPLRPFGFAQGFAGRAATSEVFFVNLRNSGLLFAFYFLLFTLFFTFGASSIISLSVSVVITTLLFIPIELKKKLAVSFLAVAFLSIFLFINSHHSQNKIFGFRKQLTPSFQTRLIYWQNGIDNFVKRPFVGSGLNTYNIINQESSRKVRLSSDYALNFFLQIASDAGIFGLLTSICLIGSVLWKGLRTIRKKLTMKQFNNEAMFYLALFVGLLASTINAFADFDWQLPLVFLIFWLMAGLLTQSSHQTKNMLQ